MRFIYALLLLLFVGVIGALAWQNQQVVTINYYLDQSVQYPLAAVVGAAYVLGMLTGWMVVGLLRSLVHRVTDENRR